MCIVAETNMMTSMVTMEFGSQMANNPRWGVHIKNTCIIMRSDVFVRLPTHTSTSQRDHKTTISGVLLVLNKYVKMAIFMVKGEIKKLWLFWLGSRLVFQEMYYKDYIKMSVAYTLKQKDIT